MVGIPLGWLLAWGAVGADLVDGHDVCMSRTPRRSRRWRGGRRRSAFAVGLPLALAAAAAPALEAARVSPIDSLRSTQAIASRRSPAAFRACSAPPCVSCRRRAFASLPAVNGLPVFGFLAAVAIVFGQAFLVPSVLSFLSRHGRAVGACACGIESRLAHANLAGAIPRLSVSVAALAVSLAMLVAIAVMIGSFRETVVYWVNQTLQADLYIATARRSNLDSQATISPALEAAVRADRDVAAVDRFRSVSLPFRDRLIVAGAGDFRVLLSHGALVFKAPRDGREAMRAAIGRDALVVSEAFALRFGVGRRRNGDDSRRHMARIRFRSAPSTTTTRPIAAWSSWTAAPSPGTSATCRRRA